MPPTHEEIQTLYQKLVSEIDESQQLQYIKDNVKLLPESERLFVERQMADGFIWTPANILKQQLHKICFYVAYDKLSKEKEVDNHGLVDSNTNL
jgi:hypothetical protein